MQCPVDGATLQMTERSGVEIDYCPTCRGVWLDRGELDKILERAADAAPRTAPQAVPQARFAEPGREVHGADRLRTDGRPKKRESFLSDLLDF